MLQHRPNRRNLYAKARQTLTYKTAIANWLVHRLDVNISLLENLGRKIEQMELISRFTRNMHQTGDIAAVRK